MTSPSIEFWEPNWHHRSSSRQVFTNFPITNLLIFWPIRIFFFFNWELLGEKNFVDSYSKNTWKHVVTSIGNERFYNIDPNQSGCAYFPDNMCYIKVPFKYYVSTFWGCLDPPLPKAKIAIFYGTIYILYIASAKVLGGCESRNWPVLLTVSIVFMLTYEYGQEKSKIILT